MKLIEFSENDQEQINKGLSTAVLSDKQAADKILALVPEGWIEKIPFFVRKHSTTKTIERIAEQYPELMLLLKKKGNCQKKSAKNLEKLLLIFSVKKWKSITSSK